MNTRDILPIVIFIGAILAGGVLGRCTAPDPIVRYPDVLVPETVLVAGEPDTVASLRERINQPIIRPEQTAVAPGAAEPDVSSFCSAAGWTVQRTDTVILPIPSALAGETYPQPSQMPQQPESQTMLLIRSGAREGDILTLTGPRSNGDLFRGDYQIGGGDFQFRVSGGEIFVQGDRWHGVKTWAERLAYAAGGAALGYVVGGQ